MTQLQLFDDQSIREPEITPKERRRRNKATPHPVGSGPDGETCRSCMAAFRRIMRSGKAFYKCHFMAQYWTAGSGTDIKLNWPACESWQAKDSYPSELILTFYTQAGLPIPPQEELDAVMLYTIADWFREQGREGAFLTLAEVAKRVKDGGELYPPPF